MRALIALEDGRYFEGESFGATGTPSFFLGLRDAGTSQVRVLQTIAGARPFADFEQAIARVEALVN